MDDGALRDVVLRTLAHEQELIARHRDATVLRGDGYVGSVLPVADSSIANAVMALRRGAITSGAIDDVERAYREAGVGKWGVWIDPEDSASREAVETAGLLLDSEPVRMAALLNGLDLTDAPPARPISLQHLGRVNDLAYGHADNRLEILTSGLPADAVTTYGAFDDDGEPLSAVLTTEHDGDAGVWMVATVPWARGQGLAKRLMRRALADASQRGCVTTTLIASKLGAPVYTGMGYRSFGPLELWERRP